MTFEARAKKVQKVEALKATAEDLAARANRGRVAYEGWSEHVMKHGYNAVDGIMPQLVCSMKTVYLISILSNNTCRRSQDFFCSFPRRTRKRS